MSGDDATIGERWPRSFADRPSLDPLAAKMDRVSHALFRSPRLDALFSGSWLGHSLHPALTDLPIGFFTSAMVVDFFGGRSAAATAKQLVGWGNVTALPTALAGLADARGRSHDGRRVAAAHAALNAGGLAAYAVSWLCRRGTGRRLAIASSVVGATLLTAAGHLGGHMAFGADDDDARPSERPGD